MARAAMALGVRDLAMPASASPDTIARLEREETMRATTIKAIRLTLKARGAQFIKDGQMAAGPDVALGVNL